jgi:hypothetical protein
VYLGGRLLKTKENGGPAGAPDPTISQTEINIPTSFPLRLPRSMRVQANELARAEGISLNQFIAIAIAEKLARIESSSVLSRLFEGTDPGNGNVPQK